MATRQFVFGYGSLAILPGLVPGRAFHARGFVADLEGHGRSWGVAMDNRRDLAGYKYYLDGQGERPDVSIAFLDIAPDAGSAVNGVCIPVDDARLARLDVRERNYERVDVSDCVEGAGGARVWTYVGSAAGRGRLARGRERGRAAIDAGYLRFVQQAFRRLGPAEYAACAPSLAPRDLPVVELARVDL